MTYLPEPERNPYVLALMKNLGEATTQYAATKVLIEVFLEKGIWGDNMELLPFTCIIDKKWGRDGRKENCGGGV